MGIEQEFDIKIKAEDVEKIKTVEEALALIRHAANSAKYKPFYRAFSMSLK